MYETLCRDCLALGRFRVCEPGYETMGLCENHAADMWERLGVKGATPYSEKATPPDDLKPDRRRGRHPNITPSLPYWEARA